MTGIAEMLRELLALPEPVLEQVGSGAISQGHAKALLALEDKALIKQVAERIIKENMLVRDIERMAQTKKGAQTDKAASLAEEPPVHREVKYHKEMELALSTELGRRVKIKSHGKRSTLELDFYNDEELADIASRLTKNSW